MTLDRLIELLRTLPLPLLSFLLLLENLVVFGLAVGLGELVVRAFAKKRVTPPPGPISGLEIVTVASAILINTLVTIAGLVLFRAGWIRFRTDLGVFAILDVLVLLLGMDLAMYVLHRLAHHRLLFPLLHRLHHRYDCPRPLTLFILNPAETLSFGVLWLLVIAVYPASWLGMSVFLTLNVAFGTVGHLGVEPLPARFLGWPILGQLGTSTFHGGHHQDPRHNFGFYTLIWDRLFGTLDPRYAERFRKAAGGS